MASRRIITLEKNKSGSAEAYRTLRTNVQFTKVDSEKKVIMITSAGPGEGKSSTTANLAVSLAQSGKSVLIIDADMRNPTQHKFFGLNNMEGLSNALVLDKKIEAICRETEAEGLKVLTAGPIPPNPAELLDSKKMKKLIGEAGSLFDMVLIDTPPVIAVADSSILAQAVDGIILVVASGEVNREHVLQAKEQLEKVGGKILGVVLNKAQMKTRNYYYYYYYYHGEKRSRKKGRRHHDHKERVTQVEGKSSDAAAKAVVHSAEA